MRYIHDPYDHVQAGYGAPEPPPEHEVTGRLYAEIPVTGFTTTATTHAELLEDLIDAYHLRDADTLDFDMEGTS